MPSFLIRLSLCLVLAAPAQAQLLDGEFDDIELGRELIGRDDFPSVRELRNAVSKPRTEFVLMMKLYGDANNHHLPVWSLDGQRLAFQRSRIGVSSSNLLLFESLSAPTPRLLSGEGDVFDYMFCWGINGSSSFVFVRIESETGDSRLYYSSDGETIKPRSEAGGKFFYPSLYERTDGVHWLAYERNGEIVHEAWVASQSNGRAIANGTSPQWSRDGRQLLMARQVGRSGGLPRYDIVVRHLRNERDMVLSSNRRVVVRSPTWSPAESRVAFYERDASESTGWRIRSVLADGSIQPTTVIADVIVNPDFKSEGPSWEPTGQRVWCFSNEHREQEFYPLVAADVETGAITKVDYPHLATSPNDLAVNPATSVPEFAFVAHDGLTQDLFIVFLNHY
jgi:WD40-like Beta Propeller Repeat